MNACCTCGPTEICPKCPPAKPARVRNDLIAVRDFVDVDGLMPTRKRFMEILDTAIDAIEAAVKHD